MMLPRADADLIAPYETAMAPISGPVADEIMRLVIARGAEKSICPSEVARALRPGLGAGPDASWQSLLPQVRRVAVGLARAGRIEILRKGRPVAPPEDPATLKGVIRLRHRPPDNPT
jgi:hypothetical protein